jgi:ribosome-associated protein
VICHGTSERQVLAIADSIEERLGRGLDVHPDHVEGRKLGEWVLMDYIDFVVHVFVEEKRGFYRLERLWGDAPRPELPPSPDPTEAGASPPV